MRGDLKQVMYFGAGEYRGDLASWGVANKQVGCSGWQVQGCWCPAHHMSRKSVFMHMYDLANGRIVLFLHTVMQA